MFVKCNKVVVGSRNGGVSNYSGEGVTCGMQFSYFRLKRIQWRVVSGNVDAGLRHYVGTLHRVLVMMLRCDVIRDVTWHVCRGYKRTWHCVMEHTLVQFSLGKEVHVHAWIDALERPHWESLLPSNITDWVVLLHLCASAPADAPLHSKNGPGMPCSS